MAQRSPLSRPGKLICLGTGDGRPCPDRNHSSYLYELAGACVLIDCGEGVTRSLAARKFDWNRLDAVVISHTHADHIGGLPMLLQGLWLEGRTRPLSIFLPRHVIAPVRRMLQHGYLFPELFRFQLDLVPLRAGQELRFGGLKLKPFATSHLESLRRRFQGKYRVRFEAFGFILEGAGRRVVHSADLGAPGDLQPWLECATDLLVCELAHFSPARIFASLRGRPIKQAAFTHLTRRLRQHANRLVREARRELNGVVCVLPKDGDQLAF